MNKQEQSRVSSIIESRTYGVYAISNVDITDRPFSMSSNTIGDYLKISSNAVNRAGFGLTPIRARQATLTDIANYPDLNITVNDLIAIVAFDFSTSAGSDTPASGALSVICYDVIHRFQNNVSGKTFQLDIANYVVGASSYDSSTYRFPQVTPVAGANSASEYMIMPMRPMVVGQYDPAADQYSLITDQNRSYLWPAEYGPYDTNTESDLRWYRSTVFVFRDQQSVSQELTITPLIATIDGVTQLYEMYTKEGGE